MRERTAKVKTSICESYGRVYNLLPHKDKIDIMEKLLQMPEREVYKLTTKDDTPAFVYASVEQGAEAGTLTVTVDGAKVGRFRLVYGEGVGRIPEEKPALKAWLSGFIGMRERKIYTLT